jgi:hypothetical protein
VVALAVVFDGDEEPAAAPAGLGLSDLEPALLTQDDVGDGFAPQSDTEGEEDGSAQPDTIDTTAECRETLERFGITFGSEAPVGEEVSAAFERESDGVRVTHALGLRAHDDDDPTPSVLADAWGHCDRVTYELDGYQYELRLEADEVDDLGDDAWSVYTINDVTTRADTHVRIQTYSLGVLRDGVHSSVNVTGSVGADAQESEPADRDLARYLAQVADGNVRRVLEG